MTPETPRLFFCRACWFAHRCRHVGRALQVCAGAPFARAGTRSLGLGQPRTPPLWSASRTVAKGDCGNGTLVALELLHARAFRRVPHPHRRVGGRCTSEQRHTRGIHSSTGSILCQRLSTLVNSKALLAAASIEDGSAKLANLLQGAKEIGNCVFGHGCGRTCHEEGRVG